MNAAKQKPKGVLAWMAHNRVAANLLMVMLLVGGAIIGSNIRQEVFPEFDLDLAVVQVPYPGASPAEVEQGVVLAIEEAVRGVDGVKEIRSKSQESIGTVSVELLLGTDSTKALSDIKNAVDRISSFPEEIERPVVQLASNRRQVISVVVYGPQDEATLRSLAEGVRSDLLQDPRITVVEVAAVRPLEIGIEIPKTQLRQHGLSLTQVAARVREASVERPSGSVKTPGGEVLLRVAERRKQGEAFGDIALRTGPSGATLRLGDIASIDDGFRETEDAAYFNGEPAAVIQVFRVGSQTPIEVAAAVKAYVAGRMALGDDAPENVQLKEGNVWQGSSLAPLPPGVALAPWGDRSQMYRDRIDLLRRNGLLGLALVWLVMALFLEVRLAFWVTTGIPISFLGSLILLPALSVSINMISLFAFIVTLGIVVDDAIVVGEAIYRQRERGLAALPAAIAGVREVAVPVTFSVITTIVAFMPTLFVPGASGKFFRNIPLVVIAVLAISLFESLFILPAHLSHDGDESQDESKRKNLDQDGAKSLLQRFVAQLNRPQEAFSFYFERFVSGRLRRWISFAVAERYITLAICVALFLGTIGLVPSGRLGFTFLPKIDSDRVRATARLPFGAPAADTEAVAKVLTQAAHRVLEDMGGAQNYSQGIFTQVGGSGAGGGGGSAQGSHLTQVQVYLVSSDKRDFRARDFSQAWRKEVGALPGLEALAFNASTGQGAGSDLAIALSHPNLETLEQAATRLAAELSEYAGVIDIEDGFAAGKPQWDVKLTEVGRGAGLSEAEAARQLRAAFYGAEALRQQRGREEIRVMVRLPENERKSTEDFSKMILQTPGGEIPFTQAASVRRGRAFTEISRVDGLRTVEVQADVLPGVQANRIVADMLAGPALALQADFPGLLVRKGGAQKSQQETLGVLRRGAIFAMLGIFALLAVVFGSYIQPVVIMLAIPFGVVGAFWGHALMGYDLSLISLMGLVALTGVVVNDSLVLVVGINRLRALGLELEEALVKAAQERFRPILLTSLTTFFGLVPMIFETSTSARFLIPMAISLAFGVLISTVVILALVPAAYGIIEDIKGKFV